MNGEHPLCLLVVGLIQAVSLEAARMHGEVSRNAWVFDHWGEVYQLARVNQR